MIEINDEILIAKEPANVWDHLTDISNWGSWSRIMKHSAIYGPIKQGTSFKCIAGKWDFEGKIAALDLGKSIDFEANSIGLKITMRWILSDSDSGTKVAVGANSEGWIPKLFPKRVRESFQVSINTWLNSLKTRAERGNEISNEPPSRSASRPLDKRTVQFTDAISLLFKPKDPD